MDRLPLSPNSSPPRLDISPPSSPVLSKLEISPPSSPVVSQCSSPVRISPDLSPASSPVPSEPPRKKIKTWKVYSDTRHEQLSKSTAWRRAANEPQICADPECENETTDPGFENETAEVQCQAQHQDLGVLLEGNQNNVSSESSYSEQSDVDTTSSSVWTDSDSERVESDDSEQPESGNESESSHGCESSDGNDSSESGSEDEYEVYAGCEFSVDEAVLDLFTANIDNRETKKRLSDHLKIFIKYLPKNNNMPKTLTQLLNYVEQLAPAFKEISYPYCANCFLLLENEGACEACGATDRHYFYMYCLVEQIRYLFEECKLYEVLEKNGNRQSTDGVIRDIIDGSQYLKVKLTDKYSITLLLNTDGVSISGSSKTRLWPVMGVICEVPPHLRKKYMIVCGIWCDSVDAPINTLFQPVVDTLINIDKVGGVQWTHPVSQIVHRSTVTAPVICADAPARAKLQNITGHCGNQGCNTCEQQMDLIPLSMQEARVKAAGAIVKRKRGYFYKEQPAQLRSDTSMRQQAKQAFRLKKHVQGVKGPTIISCIPRLDLSKCVYAEYMHGVCLGVAKHFLKLWLTVKGPWNVSKYKAEMDKVMKSIAPTFEVCRLPRPISDYLQWKASEFRNWLLYYSLPCLSGKLPNRYLRHWSLLVKSIFLLLQTDITQENLDEANVMLNLFVKDVGRLYRQRDYVYNVHQLLHLCLYVKLWGNLWSNSAFYFESFNAVLTALIHGTKNPGKELMRNLRGAHGVQNLRSKVFERKAGHTGGTNSNPEALDLCKGYVMLDCDKAVLTAAGVNSGTVYSRIQFNRVTYTSKLYRRGKKRINYCIKFQSGFQSGFGDIKFFVLCDESLFVVVDQLSVDYASMFYYDDTGKFPVNHIVPVTDKPVRTIVLKLTDIVIKMIRVKNFLCYQPNFIEKNL